MNNFQLFMSILKKLRYELTFFFSLTSYKAKLANIGSISISNLNRESRESEESIKKYCNLARRKRQDTFFKQAITSGTSTWRGVSVQSALLEHQEHSDARLAPP